MPNPLNNVATANGYTDAGCTFDCQPSASASGQVLNAAVYYEVTTVDQHGVRQGAYPERFLTPGRGTFRVGLDWRPGERLVRLRFRSAVAGVPAQVTVS